MQTDMETAGNDEIELKDIIEFARENFKLIAATTLVAVALSLVYLMVTPKKYEGSLLLQMAQQGEAVIEAPVKLAVRLRYATSYTEAVTMACGFESLGAVGDNLGGMLKTSVLKLVPNVLELKLRATSPEEVSQCSAALSMMIAKQQHDLMEEHLIGKRATLEMLQQLETTHSKQLQYARKAEMGDYGFLVIMDKLSSLRTRIAALQEELQPTNLQSAKVLVPLNITPYPVFPNKKITLIIGLLGGVFLGVMFALIRNVVRKFKAKPE